MNTTEMVARAMAENAGFAWEYCAQSQWKSDARAGIEAIAVAVREYPGLSDDEKRVVVDHILNATD